MFLITVNKEKQKVCDKKKNNLNPKYSLRNTDRLKPLTRDSFLHGSGTGYQVTPKDTKTYLRERL